MFIPTAESSVVGKWQLMTIWLVFLLNRTEPNFWSGSGSVHQISVRVRVRFIKPWFRFGFGSSNLGSGSVRFIEAKVWFGFGSVHQISVQVQVRFGSIMWCYILYLRKKSVTIASVRKSFFAATNCNKIVFSSTEILFSLR